MGGHPTSFARCKVLTVANVSPPVRAIYFSAAGTVQVTTAGGDAVTLIGAVGTLIPLEVKSVQSLGTATLHGLYG